MAEQIIYLDTVDPIDIIGVRNEKIDAIKNYFPKLKIIARGNELKLIGSKKETENFERQFYKILTPTNPANHSEKYYMPKDRTFD